MQKLVEGVHRFKKGSFVRDQQLFEKLASGQSPLALFIACSDSRIDLGRLTQTNPGDIFVQRAVGNIVPAYGSIFGGEAATIEYAVAALKIKHVVICGHSQCGAMGGLLNPQAVENLPAVKAYLEHAATTLRVLNEQYQDITDPAERLKQAVETNVLVQLESLKTHPAVAAALSSGELTLHGWVYKFETGDVSAYNHSTQQFEPLGDASSPTA